MVRHKAGVRILIAATGMRETVKTYEAIVRTALQERTAGIKSVLIDQWVVPGGHWTRAKSTVAPTT